MVGRGINFEIAALFHSTHGRVKKTNLYVDQMESFLYCLSSKEFSEITLRFVQWCRNFSILDFARRCDAKETRNRSWQAAAYLHIFRGKSLEGIERDDFAQKRFTLLSEKKSTLRLFSTFYFIKENHTSLRKKSTLGLPSNFYFIKAIHSSHFLDFRSAHFWAKNYRRKNEYGQRLLRICFYFMAYYNTGKIARSRECDRIVW